MTLLIVGAFLVVVGLFLYVSNRIQKNWSVVAVASGEESHEAYSRYEYLKNCGVTCKLKSEQLARTAVGIAQPSYAAGVDLGETVRVFVRTKELELAQSLLDKFGEA